MNGNGNEATIETALEALRAQTAQLKSLTDSWTDMGHATAELIRRSATARAPRKAPPPVSIQLRQFAKVLADKVAATAEMLSDDQRARVAAIVPAFTFAVLANEPDVIALVTRWLDLAPEKISRDLASNLDAIERRFAS